MTQPGSNPATAPAAQQADEADGRFRRPRLIGKAFGLLFQQPMPFPECFR